ncbi:hypothetical protein SAMN05880574_10134 [Chryseobacterium sp. RU37D]|uniref:hypothetical protein n=1 Tax=Chryseobacterium sp. RU37D TaxID=1907397 RepID=UPI0009572259|nr:hypothetical protein [Chryseobacterium sp. RU37D]SIP86258.1 hypothetical protein SAMN05880574_10134 [Chryseobacterium sp. RU37D]
MMNNTLYFQAITQHKIKATMFIFLDGKHKIGIINNAELTDNWKKLFSGWLKIMVNK